ncbi:MAG: hypothetical protein KIT68_03475 [Phycisphaeraceae bacterium]|nr:hypothetical protein [Phycisphaeraceae bacterium]
MSIRSVSNGRLIRLMLLATLTTLAGAAIGFAEPAHRSADAAPVASAEQHEQQPARGTVVPGPGSIGLVVLAGGCLLYGRKRRD